MLYFAVGVFFRFESMLSMGTLIACGLASRNFSNQLTVETDHRCRDLNCRFHRHQDLLRQILSVRELQPTSPSDPDDRTAYFLSGMLR